MTNKKVAVFIDADNVSAASGRDILEEVSHLGDPIIRRAYGTPQAFQGASGWQVAQRDLGFTSIPVISNIAGKNAADIALVIDAMACLYEKDDCAAFALVSNDSDYTALAKKIRESGREVYGIGTGKAPQSFRSACTRYIVLPKTSRKRGVEKPTAVEAKHLCPRCEVALAGEWTKSRNRSWVCPTCGGMATNLRTLGKNVSEESLAEMREQAAAHLQPGCVCPGCGVSMSLLRVGSGKRTVEIDVCPACGTVWYDKDEFETLVPEDGLLKATVSAGKAFRREIVTLLAADFRMGRNRPRHIGELKALVKKVYHAPDPDIQAIVDALRSQKVLTVSKTGGLAFGDGNAKGNA